VNKKLVDQAINSMSQKDEVAWQITLIAIQKSKDTVNLDQNPKSVSPPWAKDL